MKNEQSGKGVVVGFGDLFAVLLREFFGHEDTAFFDGRNFFVSQRGVGQEVDVFEFRAIVTSFVLGDFEVEVE